VALVAVAQLSCGRCARQPKQDDDCSDKHAAARRIEATTRAANAGQEPEQIVVFACSPKRRPHDNAGSALSSAFLPAHEAGNVEGT
jgi:hypothetical protein